MNRMLAGAIMTVMTLTILNAQETEVFGKIDSVGLFKNGLAIVRREVAVEGNGTYLLKDIPKPIHGTFWIESNARVVTRMSKRLQSLRVGPNQMSLKERLMGQFVQIALKGEMKSVLEGTVSNTDKETSHSWNRTYQPQPYYGSSISSTASAAKTQFLTLKTDDGITGFDASQILYYSAKAENKTAQRMVPVMLFDVTAAPKSGAIITFSYLTNGLSWIPSYRVDLGAKNQMTIEQKAVIKNELGDLTDADVKLISGFPNVKFANVASPLSLENTWSSFFQQLSQRPNWQHASMANVISQQAISYNRAAPTTSGDFSVAGKGEGVDIHYQPVGPLNLQEGDSLALTVSKKGTSYERLVEWIIPDTRTAKGRYIQDYERQKSPEKYQNTAWDSIRFKNPFDFPMTTAPLMITGKTGFQGQTLSYWANPGEPTTQHITKALSVRTQHSEHEVKGKREVVYIGGDDYHATNIEGNLVIRNSRSTPLKVIIRRRFSGILLEAGGTPTDILLEEGAFSVNERHELSWELNLKPKEEMKLNYHYSILVDR